MPRARNLKPGFFKDAKVVACSFESRILFQGLWCLADYTGRLKCVPVEIKMEIFPADDVDVSRCLDELEENQLIERYTDHSGSTLVQVLGFSKHQNPHQNERYTKDREPAPCLPSKLECETSKGDGKSTQKQQVEDALRVLREYSESNPADSLFLIPDSLLRDGEKPSRRFAAEDMDLPDQVDREPWREWCQYRSSKKKPVSAIAAKKQIELLEKHDPEVQRAIINRSIQNDYQGLFEPQGDAGNSGSKVNYI